MFDIFKWFFGIVGVIILAYIIILIFKGILNFTTGQNIETGTSTSETILASSTSTFANWLKKLYTPAPYVGGGVIVEHRNPIADKILNSYSNWDKYSTSEDDFDKRWGGKYSQLDTEFDLKKETIEQLPKTTRISDKLPKMLFPSPILKNLKVTEKCVVAGCSMQICIEQSLANKLVTTCEFRKENICYRQAVCEINLQTGRCGWKVDNTLARCLQAM